MKIYNTLTKKKEEFVPITPGKVGIYVCGPTVYNFIHIGNARPMIVFDTLRRYFEYKGMEVNYVSNFTDVDDKIIKKSIEEGVCAHEISERYIAECKKDMEGMNVKPATHHPKATEEIDGMIEMISTLIEKGYAYEALKALTDHLHDLYPRMEFISFTEPENTASRKLLEKLDYKDLGYIPKLTSEMYVKWLQE